MLNKLESALAKLGIWALGIMFTAIFLMVSLTFSSQKSVEQAFNEFRVVQYRHNDYTIRRLSADSVALNELKTEMKEIKAFVEAFKESPAKCQKLEAIKPKEYETNIHEIDLQK